MACINHMSQRMYKGLENIIKESTTHTKEARSKGKQGEASTSMTTSLSGKGRFTGVRMKKWSKYYRNAIMKNTHDPPLPRDASERLPPLSECLLSKPELLERCMSLGISNANESLDTVIWKRAPKVFSSSKTVEIAVAMELLPWALCNSKREHRSLLMQQQPLSPGLPKLPAVCARSQDGQDSAVQSRCGSQARD